MLNVKSCIIAVSTIGIVNNKFLLFCSVPYVLTDGVVVQKERRDKVSNHRWIYVKVSVCPSELLNRWSRFCLVHKAVSLQLCGRPVDVQAERYTLSIKAVTYVVQICRYHDVESFGQLENGWHVKNIHINNLTTRLSYEK